MERDFHGNMFIKYMISLLFLTRRGVLTLLSPPVNVTITSVNLRSELHWSSTTNDENVQYTVQYRVNREFHGRNKESSDHDDWLEIPECSPTRLRRCNLTSAIDAFINATLRVRAQEGEQISHWSQSRPFKAVDQSRLGPPNVTLWARPETGGLYVRIQDPFHRKDFSHSVQHLTLLYRLYYKKQDGDWMIYNDTSSPASISHLEAGLNYCVRAYYVWRGALRPNSVPSVPKCAVISESEKSRTIRTVWVTVLIILSVFGVLLMCICMVNKNYDEFKRVLQPPLQLPEHVYKFLSGEEQFVQPPVNSSSSSSSSSEEEPFDKISLVTMEDQGDGGGGTELNT